MRWRGRGCFRSGIGVTAALACALVAHNANATPPAAGAGPIPLQIPELRGSVTVNLRELTAITGSAPLRVERPEIYLNGEPAGLVVSAVQSAPGAVCVSIENGNFIPPSEGPADYSLRFALSSASFPTPVQHEIAIANNPGPTTDPQAPSCADPNARPIANAGTPIEVFDLGEPGELVTLQGSGSDANADNVLTYQWSGPGLQLPPGPNASIQVALAPGTYTYTLVVMDDSGDPDSNTSERSSVTVSVIDNAPPTADAGPDISRADSDGVPGELLEIVGNGDDPDGENLQFGWYLGEVLLGSQATLATRLDDGVNELTLMVTDSAGESVTDTVTVTVASPSAPTLDAGEYGPLTDSDGLPGEPITLIGTAEDPEGIETYAWRVNGNLVGSSATFETNLPDGANQVEFIATDTAGVSASDFVTITVAAPVAPTASIADIPPVTDSDGAPGEEVELVGTASDADGRIVSYSWRIDGSVLGTGATLRARIPDGITEVELIVTDNVGLTASDSARVTIASASIPTANAGADRTVPDSDSLSGEDVTLDASSSAATGGIASYVWRNAQEEEIASGATPTVRLPDGTQVLTLVVTSNAGTTASDTVAITVTAAPQIPTANAGGDQSIEDSDREEGEVVTLTGAGVDPNGQALSYEWTLQSDPVVLLGNQATLTVRLPNGENVVMLRVQDPDGNAASDTTLITVAAPAPRVALAELPNLTANKRSVALALDRACVELDERSRTELQMTEDQQAMLERCDGLYFNNTQENQSQALDALGAEDFAAARTQTLLFSNTLYASVMDRLVALRGGARGLSLAGLNIVVDGQLVPLAQLQEMAKGLLGGGASSDADRAGGLLSDRVGLWARGNYSVGEKDQSSTSPRFEADQWALIGGLDYRLSDRAVIGASFAYGESGIEFDPAGEGALDTTSWAASTYGSLYAAKNFYFDAILNVAQSDYEAQRNITYVDGTGLIDADAQGTTDGMTLSGGVSVGYDFLWGRFTFSPTVGAFYIDATIDGFVESGAAGLNLIYDEQTFSSLTGNLGLRMTYAVNTAWGVLLPHFRVDYVREFEDDVDVFGVRFAGDPNANSAPPILVETDNPDRSYWRLATGFSAQFAYGFSGYVEYQRLESFEFIGFEDLSVGLRMQKSF